jgi:HK97 gp10 family phage protein
VNVSIPGAITGELSVVVDLTELDLTIARMQAIPALIATYVNLIVAEMQRLAPYDDRPNRPDGPHLRDTITAHLEGLTAEITAGEGLPDARAIFNEYGTVHMAARPYFRPAMERYVPAFLAELQAMIGGV